MTYQIRDWNRNFENNKSREIDQCSFICLPNKQHGMGFRRIMAELDGATIYGIWVCILAACSQQKAPRLGWLTEDGKKTGAPWTSTDIALKIGRPTNEIERCISVVSSPRIGWLSAVQVPTDCPPDADEVPTGSPSTTLEGRKEGTEGKGKKEYDPAREIPPKLEAVKARAATQGLPESEAIRFFGYYESNGWRVGKNPMKSWHGAMVTWRETWRGSNGAVTRTNGANTVLLQKEYDRILERMRTVKGNYASHQTWDKKDAEEWGKLKARRDELRKILGITI